MKRSYVNIVSPRVSSRRLKRKNSGGYRKFARKPKRVFRQAMAKMISTAAETKFASVSYSQSPGLSVTGTVPPYVDLTPTITQGDGKFNREGTTCHLKSAYLNYRITLSGASQTSLVDMPLNIWFMIARSRNSPNTVVLADTDQMFYNNGTLQSFDSGDAQASWFIPNRDLWDVRYWTKRPFKIGSATGSGTTLYANNDYKVERAGRINLTKMYRKLFRFRDNSGSTPQGNNWFLFMFVQKYDYSITTANWDPPSIIMQQNITFKDY